MDDQLYVITVLLVFILVVLLANLCVTAIFLQPVIIESNNRDNTEYDSI